MSNHQREQVSTHYAATHLQQSPMPSPPIYHPPATIAAFEQYLIHLETSPHLKAELNALIGVDFRWTAFFKQQTALKALYLDYVHDYTYARQCKLTRRLALFREAHNQCALAKISMACFL